MAFKVSSSQRRLVMAALLSLAVLGAVIRVFADNPSTARDIGSLLLVLWLPAVGSLIGYVKGKLPAATPPPTDFPAGAAFAPHITAQVDAVPTAAEVLRALSANEYRCTAIVGRRGFTVRMAVPVAQWLATNGPQTLALECLRPEAALPHLAPGTRFHLAVGTTAVAKGHVLAP